MNLEVPVFSESMSRTGKALRVTHFIRHLICDEAETQRGKTGHHDMVARHGQPCQPELQGLPEHPHFGFLEASWGSLAQSLPLPWRVPCPEVPLAKAPPDLGYGVSKRETAWVRPAEKMRTSCWPCSRQAQKSC